MWGAKSVDERVSRRLAGVASPGWVPTPESVDAEIRELATPPAAPVVPDPAGSWEAGGRLQRPRRLPPGAGAAAVLVAVGSVVGAGVLWLLAWPSGQVVAPSPQPASPVAPAAVVSTGAAAASSSASSGQVVVDVEGQVRRPGVLSLPVGSRVTDALEAAGGVTRAAVTVSLNLARMLVDGEQVVVPGRGRPVGPGVQSPVTPGAPATVNLNSATLDQLDTLPGIGPVLAQRILDYRTANGPFTSVDQLQDVSGIGEATYADLAPLVSV